jgi:two-component system sensor kinase FixL
MPTSELLAVMDAAVDAVILIDHAGLILAINRAGEHLFGWSAVEMVGRNVNTLMHEPHATAHDGYIARHLATGESRVIGVVREVEAVRRDGSTFPAHLSIGRIADAGPPRFVGFVRDSTAQHEHIAGIQEETHRSVERLMHVSRMATMGEMAAGIAHELNQPLTAIANYARASERFLEMPEPELDEVREAVREINTEAMRAGAIIQKLRRLVRGDAESRTRVAVNELVGELRPLVAAEARMRDTPIKFELGQNLPDVLINSAQIMHALLNLVRNALESAAANAPGDREVMVRTCRTKAGDPEIAVCDNGPGVAAEIRHQMFDPFQTTKQQGTGLGLPMSRTIAEAHGGALRYEPLATRGACFVLTLPAAETVT